jgi:predicted Fe-Mo cluster-binding NifX family protein
MKIVLTTTEPSLEASIDPRFGRCPYFLIVETDTLDVETMENTTDAARRGVGVDLARSLIDKGVRHVLTGNCGPGAYDAFMAEGVDVTLNCSGPVRQAVEQFKAGGSEPEDS